MSAGRETRSKIERTLEPRLRNPELLAQVVTLYISFVERLYKFRVFGRVYPLCSLPVSDSPLQMNEKRHLETLFAHSPRTHRLVSHTARTHTRSSLRSSYRRRSATSSCRRSSWDPVCRASK